MKPTLVSTLVRVRDRVLDDHRAIRLQIDELELCATALERAGGSDAADVQRLQRAVRTMLADFRRHLDYEDSRLVPLVARIEQNGAEQARGMRKEHHDQREMIRLLEREVSAANALTLASEVRVFVQCLRADMNCEERDLRQLASDSTEVGPCSG